MGSSVANRHTFLSAPALTEIVRFNEIQPDLHTLFFERNLRIIRIIGIIRKLLTGNAMHATASELNKHPGRLLSQASREPVIIEKSGHPVAVIVSYERYIQLEDAYWGELAIAAEKDKSLGRKKTMDFLQEK